MEALPQNPQTPTPQSPAEKAVTKSYAVGVAMALVVTLSFMAGVFVGDLRKPAASQAPAGTGKVLNRDAKPPSDLHDVDFQSFWDIWKTVKEKYVQEPPSDTKMFYGAVGGMVGSLGDPYSVFFDPDTAQKFNKDLEGEFEGIGAEIGTKQDQLTVIAPLPGTPADKAGIKAGDRIIAIDGVDTSGMPIDDAVNRIRGAKGTKVKLLIMRDGFKEPKEFEIVRDKITVASVKSELITKDGKKIAHVTITHFNETTASSFSDAVRKLSLDEPDGFILDLRNDPGGYLDAAVAVAGEWIPHDTVVTEKFSDGTKKNYPSDGSARLADMPTVVLANGGSASASEIVTGALADYGKAVVVGEKTYGKGSVQDYTEFSDGSALKLTVALWYTPKDRSINKEGIPPDIEVKMTPDDFENDRDPQLDTAVEVFTKGKETAVKDAAAKAAADAAAAKAASDAKAAGTTPPAGKK